MFFIQNSIPMSAIPIIQKLITKKDHWVYLILCLLLLLPNIIWGFLDKSVWPWDQAWYAEESIRLWVSLITPGAEWFKDMLNVFHTKAPLIAWFGQFFILLSGILGIHEALLLSILVVSYFSLVLTYSAAQHISVNSKLIPLLAVLVVASAPLFVAMSHEYFVEIYQVFAVVYTYWILFAINRLNRFKIIYHLLFALAISFGAKITTVLYNFIPFGIILYHVATKACFNSEIKSRDKLNFVLSLMLFCFVMLWHLTNFSDIYSFALNSSSGSVALNYGKVDLFYNKIAYWLGVFSNALATRYTLILIIMGFFSSIFICFYKYAMPKKNNWILICLIGLQMTIPIVAFSLNINEENRYILPILPSLAFFIVLTAPLSSLYLYFCLIVFSTQWLFVQSYSYSLHSYGGLLNYWLKAVNYAPEEREQLYQATKQLCTDENAGFYVVGVEYPAFNANTLAFLGSLVNRKCRFTSLGYAATDVSIAIRRIDDIDPKGFLTLKKSCQTEDVNFVNVISKSAVDYFDNNSEYRNTKNFGNCIVLYQKKTD